eukprot:1158767-Rhodomonas_salina.3
MRVADVLSQYPCCHSAPSTMPGSRHEQQTVQVSLNSELGKGTDRRKFRPAVTRPTISRQATRNFRLQKG